MWRHVLKNTLDFIISCEIIAWNLYDYSQSDTYDEMLRKNYVKNKLKIHCEKKSW